MTIRTSEEIKQFKTVYNYCWYDTILSIRNFLIENKELHGNKHRIISIEWTIHITEFDKRKGTYNKSRELYLTNSQVEDLEVHYYKMKKFLMNRYPEHFIWEELEFINNI